MFAPMTRAFFPFPISTSFLPIDQYLHVRTNLVVEIENRDVNYKLKSEI